jgi:hypothetical protein
MTEQSKIKIENLKSYGDPAESAGESGQSHQMTAGSELLAVSSKRQEKSRWLEELLSAYRLLSFCLPLQRRSSRRRFPG